MSVIDKYKELKREKPNLDNEMVMTFIEEMPDEALMLFNKMTYGCHIVDEEMYNKAVGLLEWVENKGKGAKWSVEDITRLSNIDFDTKDYYPHDLAYAVNMFYSDFCNIFTDSSYYIKMGINYLEDNDYWCDASERAYKNAKERIRHSG